MEFRKLTDTEIALIRFKLWPCCGEREVAEVGGRSLMRTLQCPRCGTIIKMPTIPVDVKTMREMCVMIHEPNGYDPSIIARREGLGAEQVERANQILDAPPYEARLNRRLLRKRNWTNLQKMGMVSFYTSILATMGLRYGWVNDDLHDLLFVLDLLSITTTIGVVVWLVKRKEL